MVIFHCYVSLPEGTIHGPELNLVDEKKNYTYDELRAENINDNTRIVL